MTVFFDLSAALDTNLNTMTGLPPVAWQNIKYEPVNGTLYIRPTLLPADSTVATIGTGTDINQGIYQIDIFSPLDEGKNEAMLMSDTIAEQFKRDKELVYNGRTVVIRSTSQRIMSNEDSWAHYMVEVVYYSYTGKR